MTLKLEGDLDILKVYLHTENEVAGLRHSKLTKTRYVWQTTTTTTTTTTV